MEKKELKWNPTSKKPAGKYANVVVLVEGNYIYYDIRYDEDEGFLYWKNDGYNGAWWAPIEEEVIGWMYEDELSAYLTSLEFL